MTTIDNHTAEANRFANERQEILVSKWDIEEEIDRYARLLDMEPNELDRFLESILQKIAKFSAGEDGSLLAHIEHRFGKNVVSKFDLGQKVRNIRKRQAELGTEQITSETWPDPEPIRNELLPVESLPETIIPEPLRLWLLDTAHRMQCPIDFVAAAAVVMTGALIGAGCGIRPMRRDDWLVVPNLWGGVVGRPGMLKSPAIAEILRPLTRLEAQAKEHFDDEQREHQAELEMFKAEKEALKFQMIKTAKGNPSSDEMLHDPETLKQQFAELLEPEKPIWRRYESNDATIEKMGVLLNENPRGILLSRDELIGLLRSFDREDRAADRAFYLEAWNGTGSKTTDRIGRGTIRVENLCVSIFGGIQPSKLVTYLNLAVKSIDNDGLMQRFQVMVYPDEPKGWKLVDERPNIEARDQAYRVIEKMANINVVEHGAITEEQEKRPYFHFTDDAQEVFNEWLSELLKTKLPAEDSPVMQEHLAKYRSLMPSLALIFHLINVADGNAEGPVSLLAAKQAAAWCEYLESHARRIYGLVVSTSILSAAKLAEKLRKGKLEDGFTVRDVYKKNWNLLTDRKTVEPACEELVAAGWLREKVTPPAFGQKEKVQYLINPRARNTNGKVAS